MRGATNEESDYLNNLIAVQDGQALMAVTFTIMLKGTAFIPYTNCSIMKGLLS